MKDTTYNVTRRMVEIVLPATSAAYFSLSEVLGLPAADKVVGTIAVLTTFLGALIGVSTRRYYRSGKAYDGEIVAGFNPETNAKVYSLNVDMDMDEIPNRNSILFKVKPNVELVDTRLEVPGDSQPLQGL